MNGPVLRSFRSLNTVRTSLRYNSSGSKEKAPFLSDILSRIEKINLNKNTNREKPKVEAKSKQPVKKASKRATQNKGPRTDASTAKSAEPVQPVEKFQAPRRIAFQNHPMFSPRLDNGKIQKAEGQNVLDATGVVRKPRATETSRSSGRVQRSSKPRRNFSKRPLREAQSDSTKTITSRKVEEKKYQPSLANTFLYGKATNFQISLTSRITSVIKSQLLKSKYPFHLPKSVIENAPETANNRFLLSQSSFSLDVDQDKVKSDINRVVKGEAQYLDVESDADLNLNRNPTLTYDQKVVVSKLAKGKGLRSVFANAHWNQ